MFIFNIGYIKKITGSLYTVIYYKQLNLKQDCLIWFFRNKPLQEICNDKKCAVADFLRNTKIK